MNQTRLAEINAAKKFAHDQHIGAVNNLIS